MGITSLGEERANLSAFRTFVRFELVWICLFPLTLGVWEGMWFVIVAVPGLFSYLCLQKIKYKTNENLNKKEQETQSGEPFEKLTFMLAK